MSKSNSEAISFFENLQKQFPIDSDGNINYRNFDTSTFEFKYVCSKMPEIFMRSEIIFKVFYDFYYPGKRSYDEVMFSNMMQNGFSDIKEFERLYPAIQELAKIVSRRIDEYDEYVSMLCKRKELYPDSLQKDIEKFHDVFEKIIQNEGWYDGNDARGIEDVVLPEAKEEDKELLTFAIKICKYCESMYKGWCFSEEFLDQATIERRKSDMEGYIKEIEDAHKEINIISQKLKKAERRIKIFGFIPSIKEKAKKTIESLKTKKESAEDSIEYANINIARTKRILDDDEEMRDILRKYGNAYVEAVREKIIPQIKQDVVNSQDKEILERLIDYFFSEEMILHSTWKPLVEINNWLVSFTKISFDEYITKFKNALRTLYGLPNVFLSFEKLDNKDLYSFLDIARSELKQVPLDNEHGYIDSGFRTIKLKSKGFLGYAPPPDKVPYFVDKLNNEFKDVLQEENLEEYIKKVGILWYKFMVCHPFNDGNGRTGRYLFNTLLAHRNIIVPALYTSHNDKEEFNTKIDKAGIYGNDLPKVGEIILSKVKELGIDLSGQNRLGNANKSSNIENEQIDSLQTK